MSFYNAYITPLCTSAFLWGLRTYNIINDSWLVLLEENPFLQRTVSEVKYGTQVIYSFMTSTRMESRELPWMAIYGLLPNEVGITNRFTLIENFQPFFSSYLFEDLFGGNEELEYTMKYISGIGSRITSNVISPLVVIKGIYEGESIYLARKGSFSTSEKQSMIPYSCKKVSTPFLSIEYTHPEMKEAIELKLDAGWWRVGNELFTPAFVLRALEYQSNGYYFDEDYTIRLLDTHCNIIILNSNMYIVITENGYEWKREEVFPQEDGYMGESDSSDFLCITKDEDKEE